MKTTFLYLSKLALRSFIITAILSCIYVQILSPLENIYNSWWINFLIIVVGSLLLSLLNFLAECLNLIYLIRNSFLLRFASFITIPILLFITVGKNDTESLFFAIITIFMITAIYSFLKFSKFINNKECDATAGNRR
ncbi:hypothetical protein [Flavobacterium selenitireducens]|uniref:hypothetical protein n=1 Tax=Flavobacterium selenitireducens TaxID=2722704 RepID=UPI00168AA856|nr:hypothetical protein [Flavobacterium selenitireducens]MBD3581569.1 hypothetical protein [Flavobacterium selenitireducens]